MKERNMLMNTETDQNVYVKVKDMADNEFVCPLNELKDARKISDAELENCFEGDVVGRYAGLLNIIDTET
jgi:hypothetical protein